jgi:hypothetical protein
MVPPTPLCALATLTDRRKPPLRGGRGGWWKAGQPRTYASACPTGGDAQRLPRPTRLGNVPHAAAGSGCILAPRVGLPSLRAHLRSSKVSGYWEQQRQLIRVHSSTFCRPSRMNVLWKWLRLASFKTRRLGGFLSFRKASRERSLGTMELNSIKANGIPLQRNVDHFDWLQLPFDQARRTSLAFRIRGPTFEG